MSTRVVEEIDDWESEPFGGGYARLHELADDEFSGVVRAGTATLCFLNGTPVGVLDGSIEDFEDASGTAYEAPSPALPLLALMQERSDEVRAKYYTEETPISEVDSTLSDGGFSGYIELSENVLSGDYYVVYHGGRSMAVAYVGNSGQLLTDDEAFERADGEVGIYEVRPVDVEPVEIPEPADTTGAAVTTGTGSNGETTDSGTETASNADAESESGEPDTTDTAPADEQSDVSTGTAAETGRATDDVPTEEDTDDGETGEDVDERATDDVPAEEGTDDGEPGDDGEGVDDRETAEGETTGSGVDATDGESRVDTTGRTTDDTGGERNGATRESTASSRADESATGAGVDRSADRPQSNQSTERTQRRSGGGGGGGAEETGGRPTDVGAPARLETRSIPSLDPARTVDQSGDGAAGAAGVDTGAGGQRSSGPARSQESTTAGGARESQSRSLSEASGQASQTSTPDDARDQGGGSAVDQEGTARPDPSELEADLEEARNELERVETELAAVEDERDRVADERDELRERVDELKAERDDLEAEVEELQSELERLRSQLQQLEEEYGAATDAERRLSPAEALDETNLFVRYESKGDATLEAAHDGNASREAVSENLGLEHHTQFDASAVSVAGKQFGEFLRDSIQYRFVSWVVYDLLYEIRDTGKVQALQDLYDAIPKIDRAELNGSVAAEFTEDGQEKRTQESFDVVLRDRMGNALVVANLNDSREAATESMMNSLVTAASNVGASSDELAAAVLVTKSYFAPEALETAAEATSGGLLSRDKRESFVKLSRKRGYHLCLAEAREGKFHLAVPEL